MTENAQWGPGPWDTEPDDERWIDEATGLPCAAIRHPRMGHFCGYVGVPDRHPAHGMDYERAGGLSDEDWSPEEFTWANERPGGGAPDERATWWFGFDFAHLGDLLPYDSGRAPTSVRESYKTLGHTKRAAAKVAAWLAALGERERPSS